MKAALISLCARANLILLGLSALIIFVMAVLICTGIVTRYFLAYPLVWIDELVSSTLPLITLLTASALLESAEHVSIDYLAKRASPGIRRLLIALYWGACFAVSAAITYSGLLAVRFLYNHQIRSPSLLGLPDWILQLSLPVGGAFMILSSVCGAMRGALQDSWENSSHA